MVRFAIEDMPLGDFIDFFFGELMGVGYFLGPKMEKSLKTPVTINLQKELPLGSKPSRTDRDIMPKQVLIEVTIAEVTLKDDLQYGVEWYLKNPGNITGTLSTLGGLALPAGGLTYSAISSSQNFQAMLTMLAKKTNIRILSTPHVTVRDNETTR